MRDTGRFRKSHSITSLEKLTLKIKENRGGIEEEKRDIKLGENRPIIQKRFIGEVTQEVLIVTEDGCYTSRTDQ
jgi:hypothetical protein